MSGTSRSARNLLFVEKFERVELFSLLVLDQNDATERSGAQSALAIEVVQLRIVLHNQRPLNVYTLCKVFFGVPTS